MNCSDRETKRRERHKAARLRAWESTGSLYSERAEAHLTQRIRDAFAVEYGPVRESTEPPLDVMEAGEGSYARVGDSHVHSMTLDEVGAVLRLSRERVRQIEVTALEKMRAALIKLDRGQRRRGRA